MPTHTPTPISHPAGMRAMMAMTKMDIATLQQAANQPA
jgi:hypothetical protein